MFCSRCGTQIDPNSSFCSKCGAPTNVAPQAPVQQAQPQQPVYQAPPVQTYQQPVYQAPPVQTYQQPVYQAPPVQTYQQPVYQAPPVQTYQQPAGPNLTKDPVTMAKARDAVRKICASPLFLVAVICYTLFQLYYLFEGGFNYWLGYQTQEFFSILDAYRIGRDMAELHYETGFVTTIGVLLNLVIVAGLWVIFISARTKKNNTVGLTMIKVIAIIEMIAVILYLFISRIPAIIELLDSSYNVGPLLLYNVVNEGMTALAVIFFIKILTTLGAVKNAIRDGEPSRKVSGFVAVVCFAVGGIMVLEVFTYMIGMVEYMATLPILTWVGQFCSLAGAAVCVLVGVLMFQYKGLMAKVEQGTYELEQPAEAAATE